MAYYSFKEVRDIKGFKEYVKEWEKSEDGHPFEEDPAYDGDYHLVSAFIIRKLQAKVTELEEALGKIRFEPR